MKLRTIIFLSISILNLDYSIAAEETKKVTTSDIHFLNEKLGRSVDSLSSHALVGGLVLGAASVPILALGVSGLASGNSFGTVVGALSVMGASVYGAGSYYFFKLRADTKREHQEYHLLSEASADEQRDKYLKGREFIAKVRSLAKSIRIGEGGYLTGTSLFAFLFLPLRESSAVIINSSLLAVGLYRLLVPSDAERAWDEFSQFESNSVQAYFIPVDGMGNTTIGLRLSF